MSLVDSEDARAWRIQLAHLRQELLSPVSAVLGHAEIVRDETKRQNRLDILPDASRILDAAQELAGKVDGLLEGACAVGPLGPAATPREQQLRHELRTPVSAIKGYGEMLREDLAGDSIGALQTVLDHLLAAADDLLLRLDRIVQFSDEVAQTGLASDQAAAIIIADLIRSFGSIPDQVNAAAETGTILIVDDIETNCDILSRRLTGDGHRVVSVAGGRQALDTLGEQDFDLVLLDLMMPDINGFDVLVRMKANERLRRVPVIMITALADTESAIRCIEAGAEDYLPKPFDPILLRARISACLHKKRWRDREQTYLRRIEDETAKFERLLLSILPEQVVRRLNDGETIIADRFDEVSVLLADLVNFTEHSARTAPTMLVRYLNRLFSDFDALARELGVEKIKTIGDAYMAVAGIPEPRADHCRAIAELALGMLDRLDHINRDFGCSLQIRIGIHSGPVVAGVVGMHRFIYDVWGDTVNVASRLEACSVPNRVQVSQDTACHLAGAFALEHRGSINIRGRGPLKTFFVGRL